MNALLRQIADKASEDLSKLIEEGAEDILKAIHKTEEEAQSNDAKPKFCLGFKITVDLDKSAFSCDLSWSLKQTLGVCHTIDDPNQPELSSVTISGAGESVTLAREDFKTLARRLKTSASKASA